MPLAVAESTKQYPVSKDVAHQEIFNVLTSLGFHTESSDQPSGLIKASKGLGVWSWGQDITIIVSQKDGGSQVYVQSREKHQWWAI